MVRILVVGREEEAKPEVEAHRRVVGEANAKEDADVLLHLVMEVLREVVQHLHDHARGDALSAMEHVDLDRIDEDPTPTEGRGPFLVFSITRPVRQ